MTKPIEDRSRRRFLRNTLIGAAAVPAAGLLVQRRAYAQEDRVDESESTAQALNYKHDVSDVDHEDYAEGENCKNCQLYTDNGGDWGPCAAFSGREVNANGWCTAWAGR